MRDEFIVNPLSANPTKWSDTLKQFGPKYVRKSTQLFSRGRLVI